MSALPPAAFTPAEPAAPTRRDGWTPERQVQFLTTLAHGGRVRAAAARVGMSAQGAYVLRRRDPGFAAGWDAALVLARETAEQVLADRAIDGVEEVVWYHGEEVGRRRRYDSRLLLAHLARLDRAVEANPGAEALAGRFDEMLGAILDGGFAPLPLREAPPPGPLHVTEPAPAPWVAELGPTRDAAVLAAEAEEENAWDVEPDDDWEPDPEALAAALEEAAAEAAAQGEDGDDAAADPDDLRWALWADERCASIDAAGEDAGAEWDARMAEIVGAVDAVVGGDHGASGPPPAPPASGRGEGESPSRLWGAAGVAEPQRLGVGPSEPETPAEFPPLDRVNLINFAAAGALPAPAPEGHAGLAAGGAGV